MLIFTHIMHVLGVTVSGGVGMQQCMIQNHIYNI